MTIYDQDPLEDTAIYVHMTARIDIPAKESAIVGVQAGCAPPACICMHMHAHV